MITRFTRYLLRTELLILGTEPVANRIIITSSTELGTQFSKALRQTFSS